MSEQQDNIERVGKRIGAAILQFCDGREKFHAEDMREYVRKAVGMVAPGSPDRILRDLRKKGLLDYKVLSRKNSHYQIIREAHGRLF